MPPFDKTRLVHGGRSHVGGAASPVNPPLVRTSTVLYPDAETMRASRVAREDGRRLFTYGARGTPTTFAFEDALTELEGGHRALLFPTGLAAIAHVLVTTLKPGDHLLISETVYAPARALCVDFLAPRGVVCEFVSGGAEAFVARLRPETRLIYAENPGSIVYDLMDLPALSRLAAARGILLAVDNTWGSSLLHRPLALGADISIVACTKYIGGHSDVMLGAVICNERAWPDLWRAATLLGQTVSPDDAWLALRGLRSLSARLAQHRAHAMEVARFLLDHPKIASVLYPALEKHPGHELWARDFSGANGLLTVAFASGIAEEGIDRFVSALRLFGIGASWGGYESLAAPVAPQAARGWSHSSLLVRLHIGLEDPRDLRADLEQALARA